MCVCPTSYYTTPTAHGSETPRGHKFQLESEHRRCFDYRLDFRAKGFPQDAHVRYMEQTGEIPAGVRGQRERERERERDTRGSGKRKGAALAGVNREKCREQRLCV